MSREERPVANAFDGGRIQHWNGPDHGLAAAAVPSGVDDPPVLAYENVDNHRPIHVSLERDVRVDRCGHPRRIRPNADTAGALHRERLMSAIRTSRSIL